MAVPSPSKSDLRIMFKKRRDNFVSKLDFAHLLSAESALADLVMQHIGARQCVAAYLPVASEIGTMVLMKSLAKSGHVTALPHVVSRTDTPRFLAWKPGDAPTDGPFGLKQPRNNAPEVVPDVILAPLLGFDLQWNRIGYGAGHYDRAFAAYPNAVRIGLAWSIQQCDALPVDAWDVPLHAVATETGWICQ
jgi:5-formyltetrahydrofolate cyclo-ligase